MNIETSRITVRLGDDYGGFRVPFEHCPNYFSESFIKTITNGISHLQDTYNYYDDDDDCIIIPVDGLYAVYLEVTADYMEHFELVDCPEVSIAFFGDEVLTQVWDPVYEVTHFNTEQEALQYLKEVAPPVAEYIIKEYHA